LLRLGGERRGEGAASDHFNEPSALHHWVFPQVVCESGAKGCGAWGNRAGSMQEPSLQAGASLSEHSAWRGSNRASSRGAGAGTMAEDGLHGGDDAHPVPPRQFVLPGERRSKGIARTSHLSLDKFPDRRAGLCHCSDRPAFVGRQ
jgi:hypothetical protein